MDEPILYGANTEGMLPIVLHPDEWLDGAIVPSLQSWFGGTETYFYQNHPVILNSTGAITPGKLTSSGPSPRSPVPITSTGIATAGRRRI